MQKSNTDGAAKVNRRQVQASTTLSRKYTKRPARKIDNMVQVKRSPKVKHFYAPQSAQEPVAKRKERDDQPVAPAMPHPMQVSANAKLQKRMAVAQPAAMSKISAKELKDQAIQKALASANQPITEEKDMQTSKMKSKSQKSNQVHFGFWRVMLALSCAAVAVFAIVYFVNLNMPDISMRVAAMQTGMDPAYPNYVPRDYNISGITSEDGRIIMEFKNSNTDDTFTLTEEKSSWDTNALLSNYVKEAYGEDYTIIREQGLTIYVNGSNAAWVNGGMVYKITANSDSLTNKQIKSIAVSL